MVRRQSIAVFVFLVVAGCAGAALGCEFLTKIPTSQRIESFFQKTVQPLWRHGFNEPYPEPENLEWIRPEKRKVDGEGK